MKKLTFCIGLLFLTVPSLAQLTLSGEWEGAIDIRGQKLIVIFHIEGESGNYSGTLDIPQQGANGLQLKKVELIRDSVSIAFKAGQVAGEFNGLLEQDTLITGTYTQGVSSLPFRVSKTEANKTNDSMGEGPELLIEKGAIQIGGTLVLPKNITSAPLVIMISGSGAQNRDSEIFNFKIFAHIADHLQQQGIASFRYDDRQIGQSTGSFSEATLDTLVSDVKAIIQHLSDSIEFKFDEIILLGHSQGGIVAGKLAAEYEAVDKLVLMASSGISLKQILRFQVRQAYGTNIHAHEEVSKEISAREKLMTAIREDDKVEEAKIAYKEQYIAMLNNLPEQQRSGIRDVDAVAQRQVDLLEQTYRNPQMQSLLFYDPTQDLRQIDIPVLVLFGEKDTQVTTELNRDPIENALKEAGGAFQIKTIPDANHLFQKANTGGANEYALLDKNFIEGFLNSISSWIKK